MVFWGSFVSFGVHLIMNPKVVRKIGKDGLQSLIHNDLSFFNFFWPEYRHNSLSAQQAQKLNLIH